MDHDDGPIAAGRFSAWLDGMELALRGAGESDVPCGGCTACCTSSQFIPIEPDEATTLAAIPSALLFPAPRRPRGHVLLGYDERGHCPMLIDDVCTIYEDRPRACRTYDCRVFPASGVEIEDRAQREITARPRWVRWRFDPVTDAEQETLDSVHTAAAFIRDHPDALPDAVAPATATQRAVLAIRLREVFLGPEHPEPDVIRARVDSSVRRHRGEPDA